MKTKFFHSAAVASYMVSTLAIGTVNARQDASGGGAASVPSSAAVAQPPAPASTALVSPTPTRPKTERLSHLMGSTIKDNEGNTLGQINDFVLNPESGEIQYAIVLLTDQSTKLTAVPWQLIKRGMDPANCTLNVSKDKLTSAQTFEASSWPDFSQLATEQQIYSHYGIHPENMGGWRGGSGTDSGSGTSNGTGTNSVSNPAGKK